MQSQVRRFDRYQEHAIRKNVAAAQRSATLEIGVTDPWGAAFEAAATNIDDDLCGLIPCGVHTGIAEMWKRIKAPPLIRDEERWARLRGALMPYSLAFGQPKQENTLVAPQRRGHRRPPDQIADLCIVMRSPGLDH